jgi:hypothetical protein
MVVEVEVGKIPDFEKLGSVGDFEADGVVPWPPPWRHA